MSDTDAELLRLALMRVDIRLKTKQTTWETPKNIAILAAAIASVSAVIFGLLGYKIGQQPQASAFPTHITVQLEQPR